MTGVTAGGVTLGVGILVWYLIGWYKGHKALMKDPLKQVGELVAFAFGWAWGTLGTLSVMGLIGWAFSTLRVISNWLGDAALVIGVNATAGKSAQGNYLPLTTQGSYVMVLATIVAVAVMKKRACGGEVKMGAWVGATLGTSAGVAGVTAVPLATAANWLGSQVYGAL